MRVNRDSGAECGGNPARIKIFIECSRRLGLHQETGLPEMEKKPGGR